MNNEVNINTSITVVDNKSINEIKYIDKYEEVFMKYNLNKAERVFAYERGVNLLLTTEGLCELVKSNYKTDKMYNPDYISVLLNRPNVKEAIKEITKIYYKDRDEIRAIRTEDKLGDRIEKIIDNPNTPDEYIIKLHEIKEKNKAKTKTETVIKETEKIKVKDFSMWNDTDKADATKEVTKTTKQVE